MSKVNFGYILIKLLAIVALLGLSVEPAFSKAASYLEQPSKSTISLSDEYVPGEVIVGVASKSNKVPEGIKTLVENLGGEIAEVSINNDAYLLRFKSDAQATQAIESLSQFPGVVYVERNGIMRIPPLEQIAIKEGTHTVEPPNAQYVPNDNLKGYQWHLSKILFYLTATPETTNVPCIVVLDTGVDYNHPDLAGKVYKGKDLFDNDFDPMDQNGHGTHVAGIAAAKTNNTTGISGISPNSKILAVRVLGRDGWGTNWMVSEGIKWANSQGYSSCGGQKLRVYNMSLGGSYSAVIANAVLQAKNLGRLVVAAAGNGNTSSKSYPGADPNAFGVAATEENDRRTYFSNYDTSAQPWVDIAAPGWQILSTVPGGGGYANYSGTSMASPVVAGVAARVWAKYPSYTRDQVINRIQSTADPTQGFPRAIGRVNLYRALGGTARTLQGRVLDAANVSPLPGATVIVKRGSTTICNTTTNASGFYTCTGLPATGNYQITATRSGRPPVTRTYYVGARLFNADLAMSQNLGSSSTNDWTVTIHWKGFQPFEGPGLEMDLWLYDPTSNTCYSSWSNPIDGDPWKIMIPRDSYGKGQTEAAWIRKSYGNSLQVWVTLWDGGMSPWPASARITGSGLEVRFYRNNTLVKTLYVPSSPTTSTADNWYIANINLAANSLSVVNQIKVDTLLPGCVSVP